MAVSSRLVENTDASVSWQSYMARRQFGSLNGLRCLCILPVLWHHSMDLDGLPLILTRGFLGVDMFFVLSGFLIVTLLLREKQASGEISLRHFYMRRALRIFPIYYGVLILMTLAYLLLKPESENSQLLLTTLPYYLSFTSNWSVVQAANLAIYWSLATEEQFYLLWPLLEKLLSSRLLYCVLTLLILVNQLINFGWIDYSGAHLEILDTTFTPICLGVVVAHLLHHRRGFLLVFPLFSARYLSPFYFVGLAILLLYVPADLSGWPRLSIQLLMALWLASMLVNQKHMLSDVLDFPIIARIGEVSYGIYLYHMLGLALARSINQQLGIDFHGYGLFITGSFLVYFIAELSFRFYEQPFLRLKHKFSQ
jgi:peptidoglycan/LPS O-acetylase OafA/YrhL